MRLPLQKLYEELYAQYGPQSWWPGRTRTEVIIGAILTQNTAWRNVDKAISNLRKNRALNFKILGKTPQAQLAEWIRPAGYFNQKAGYLKAFAHMLTDGYASSLNSLFRLETPELRKTLLAVKGVGPETADCILLYAAKRPAFVVDAYTRRFLAAHGYRKKSEASYDEIAGFFIAQLPSEVQLFNEYHALIVCWGKNNPKPENK
jgi:endonuclease-3 related protein